MTYEKPNSEIDRRLEENLISIRGAITRTEDIASLEEHPGWTAVRTDLRDRIIAVDDRLEQFEKLTDEERALLLKERKDFMLLVNLVDIAAERLPELYVQLKEAEQKLNERKHRNGTIHS